MSWDDDDFEVKVPADKPTIVNAWDDEDEDTGGPATDNWEDFDKPKEPKAKPTGPPEEKKTFTQVSGKKKRGKALLEKIRQKEDEEDDSLAPLKLTYEEKKKLQEQVVASDLENAKDMFAVKDSALKDSDILFGDDDNGEAEAKTEITLDSFKPRGERDYIKLAELVSKKVEPFSASAFYTTFLKEMLRQTTVNVEPEDVKDLIATLNVVVNDKLKASSAKKGKKIKKKAPTKTTAAVHEDMVDDEYDMFS
jgi:DNA repair exonuclease SbcCD nuclease subunit